MTLINDDNRLKAAVSLLRGQLMVRLSRTTKDWARGIEVDNPGMFSPVVVRIANILLWPLVRLLFRPRLRGVENLPRGEPFLLVANHSAGAGIAEIMCFIALYLRHVGPDRPLAGFALPQGFSVFPLSKLLKSIGAIPSTYDAAGKAFEKGVPILIFPGGDYETLRPVWQANRVDFGGRTGFLNIARSSGVPIIPLGIQGAHYTCPIFFRSEWLAWMLLVPRLIGLKRWGISLTGILGASAILLLAPLGIEWRLLLTWLWLGSPLVFLPIIPWRIRMQVGEPIAAQDLFAAEADMKQALRRVEREVETLVRYAG
jgi:1-acyl-sn-glycerol-3-phosphate acyltransferase